MNHLELQALRQLFFLTIEDAATHIASDQDTATWHHWERGEGEISSAVIATLREMKQKRRQQLNGIIEKINHRIGNNTMRFFTGYDDYRLVYTEGNYLDWKIYQSVAAELYSRDLERLC